MAAWLGARRSGVVRGRAGVKKQFCWCFFDVASRRQGAHHTGCWWEVCSSGAVWAFFAFSSTFASVFASVCVSSPLSPSGACAVDTTRGGRGMSEKTSSSSFGLPTHCFYLTPHTYLSFFPPSSRPLLCHPRTSSLRLVSHIYRAHPIQIGVFSFPSPAASGRPPASSTRSILPVGVAAQPASFGREDGVELRR
ncbi:hypothetical protein HDK90DRAFT_319104 [Phyllosticta capitalensis]|uniref:Transmembrane protein n=1 Tax=Phyllosticta capitalensis TaxID=121624 RepID=A0ABR1YHJ3_9PEZI